MSMPPHKPTDENRRLVESMTGFGVMQPDIANFLDIHINTLLKYYRRELDLGVVKANSKIAQSLYQQAISGNTGACIFWLKTRAGWRETIHQEVNLNLNCGLSRDKLDGL